MKHIILSMPSLYLYLMFLMVLLVAALWTREAYPPAGKPRAAAPTTGRDGAVALVVARCSFDRVPSRSSAWQPRRGRHPFHDLEANLAGSYAARVEQAIRTLRAGAPRSAGKDRRKDRKSRQDT